MPIYRKSKLIHIHIPKTGGTAIERFFHKAGDMEWNRSSWLGEEKIDNCWFELQHLTMSEVIGRTGNEFDDFRSFAVVRNPYSRLVSDFRWRQQIVKQRPQARLLSFDSFKEFINTIPKDININWRNYLKNADRMRANFLIHIRPQYQYVCSDNNEQLVNEIYCFEKLKVRFDALCKDIGLTNKIVVSGKNIAHMEFYDSETIEIVNNIYSRDFKLGSYSML